ncbi:hypothetical protein J6590_030281 [Homalodisca vitripennis]|nr:hypothetical protein J6590_030281 [Homalodisca vitripennis]
MKKVQDNPTGQSNEVVVRFKRPKTNPNLEGFRGQMNYQTAQKRDIVEPKLKIHRFSVSKSDRMGRGFPKYRTVSSSSLIEAWHCTRCYDRC